MQGGMDDRCRVGDGNKDRESHPSGNGEQERGDGEPEG